MASVSLAQDAPRADVDVGPPAQFRYSSEQYPSLDRRELGEPVMENGERVIYDRALPFMAQDVYDLGFKLPEPFGVALIGYWQRQDLILEDLSIAINDGPWTDINFVDFGVPEVENTTLQLKLDAWLFPFMNVFTTVGTFKGDGTIPLVIPARDLLNFLQPGTCPIIGAPGFCQRTIAAEALPEYEGKNFTVGTVLAVGWKQFFVTLPMSYTLSDVDIIDKNVEAWNISPRFGVTGDAGEVGILSVYFGATYLKADVDLEGSVSFDLSGIPGFDDTVDIDYQILQKNKDKWNGLIGFNWDITRKWSMQMEAGFGGSRTNAIGSATYRF